MRRKDKEIKDKKEIESVISKCDVCRIAFRENNFPYIVPVCFGYRNNRLYFHSASYGKKIEIIKKNKRVCFEFDIHGELIKSEYQKNSVDNVTIIRVEIENLTGKKSGDL